MKTHLFQEAIDLSEAHFNYDKRLLTDVILIKSGLSLNNTLYSESVLETATPLFEGVQAFADHEGFFEMSRSIRDVTGWYENVRFESGAIRADRHFSENAAGDDIFRLVRSVIEERAPKNIAGLSINAMGTLEEADEDAPRDAPQVVASLTEAFSVDDVAVPAAGGAYLENVDRAGRMQAALLEKLSYEDWLAVKPDYVTKYQTEHTRVRRNAEMKTLEAERGQYLTQTETLTADMATLKESYEVMTARANVAEKQVRVTTMTGGLSLPRTMRDALAEELLETESERWDVVIDREIARHKAMPATRPAVEGADRRESGTVDIEVPDIESDSGAPLDDETPTQYKERLTRIS